MTDPDATWFNRNPERHHRVRRVTPAERAQGVAAARVAVRRVAALKLVVLYTSLPIDDRTVLDEGAAYDFFEHALSMVHPDIHAQVRADAERDWHGSWGNA